MRVSGVSPLGDGERLEFSPVAAKNYPADGSDEDNTFAKFTPSGSVVLHVRNPNLLGKFAVDDTFYVDFVPVETPA